MDTFLIFFFNGLFLEFGDELFCTLLSEPSGFRSFTTCHRAGKEAIAFGAENRTFVALAGGILGYAFAPTYIVFIALKGTPKTAGETFKLLFGVEAFEGVVSVLGQIATDGNFETALVPLAFILPIGLAKGLIFAFIFAWQTSGIFKAQVIAALAAVLTLIYHIVGGGQLIQVDDQYSHQAGSTQNSKNTDEHEIPQLTPEQYERLNRLIDNYDSTTSNQNPSRGNPDSRSNHSTKTLEVVCLHNDSRQNLFFEYIWTGDFFSVYKDAVLSPGSHRIFMREYRPENAVRRGFDIRLALDPQIPNHPSIFRLEHKTYKGTANCNDAQNYSIRFEGQTFGIFKLERPPSSFKPFGTQYETIHGMQVVKSLISGIEILWVDDSSEAFRKGIRAGDAIESIGMETVERVSELKNALAEQIANGQKTVLIRVLRNDEAFFVALQIQ